MQALRRIARESLRAATSQRHVLSAGKTPLGSRRSQPTSNQLSNAETAVGDTFYAKMIGNVRTVGFDINDDNVLIFSDTHRGTCRLHSRCLPRIAGYEECVLAVAPINASGA